MAEPRILMWWLVVGVLSTDLVLTERDFVFKEPAEGNSQPSYLQRNFQSKMTKMGNMANNYQNSFKQGYNDLSTKVSSHRMAYSSSDQSRSSSSCHSMPEPPINSKLTCSGTSCKAVCSRNYQLPNGENKLSMTCTNGRWSIDGGAWDETPACEPVCSPPCQNNGICVQPGQCACADNFIGTFCEKKKQFCLSPPPMPKNSKLSIRGTAAVITCATGYRFPDGTSITNMECKNGAWQPTRADFVTIPNCEPICEQPCLNGGSCIALNVCQCMATHRGPQCQYDVESCSPKRLRFNGAYNCTGDNNQLKCSINCPNGVEFEFPPASQYICTYATGQYLPLNVPQCQFPPGMEVIPMGGTSRTFYAAGESSSSSSSSSTKKKGKKRIYYEGGDEEEEEEDGGYEKIITKTKVIIKKGRTKSKTRKGGYYEVDDDDADYEQVQQEAGVYSMYESNSLDVRHRIPKPAVCMTWNGNKVKTFDGLTYTANLFCSHVLVQDATEGAFSVILRSCPYGSPTVDGECPSQGLVIFLQSIRYTFEKSDGLVRLIMGENRPLPIPIQKPGIRVSMMGHKLKVVMDAVGIVVVWDTNRLVTVEATAALWNRTAGLCGTLDQDVNNDFRSKDGTALKMSATCVDSWAAPSIDLEPNKCVMNDNANNGKLEMQCSDEMRTKAEQVCQKLIGNAKFSSCLKEFDSEALLETCVSDYCFCSDQKNPSKCACDGVSVFAKDCQFRGISLDNGWRDMEVCPIACPNGRVYRPCGPSFEPSCGSTVDEVSTTCNEGCFCPEGTLQHNGQCVYIETCPCLLRGKTFQPGDTIKKDCNTCKCEKGTWKCSDLSCGSRCGAVGDPHYQTFDGKRFDFMGKCSYYLMKTDNYSIEAENVACSGVLSEDLGYATVDQPSCTKSVTINMYNGKQAKTIKLKQGRIVVVDGREATKLPTKKFDGVVKVRQASSTMVLVTFEDGLNVWWDGMSNVFIDAPASYRGKTAGLCGTFNSNIQDDFLSPEGDVESSVAAFADKWRTKETCQFAPNLDDVPHPCQVNVENKERAIKACKKLKSQLFEDCHWSVDPETYYEDCMYDLCACKGSDLSKCLCPVLTAYASECSRQGVVLNWRHAVNECAVKCPIGQVFEECGDTCYRTCEDLQYNEKCHTSCVEGCRCPPGQSLDEHNECVPTASCPCIYNGLTFTAGYKEVRPGKKHLDLCTCYGAQWKCREAADGEAERYPPAADQKARCLAVNHEEFTMCEPAEVKTCKNMHSFVPSTPAECRTGCVCQKDYVFDSFAKKCVLPKDCACHHGSKSYLEGEKIKDQCNLCECHAGSWECTKNNCPATCTSWGDSHFETYDGVDFDFQGVCSYVLSKGTLSNGNGFTISIQNVLCGSLGVTCSKSVTISIVGEHTESITLTADHKSALAVVNESGQKLKRLAVHAAGVFTIVEVPGMGLQIKWDRGTRVYVKLDVMWRGVVQGLCGNFNGNVKDDLKTPSGGIETSAAIFGHSWKLQDYCEKPTEQIDTCKAHPEREVWSQRQCGILKSDVFKSCHNEVSVDAYMKRCTYDTCACDQGGDCECLCTAVAAYAHACSMKGIAIRWRTPTMCPMQCDAHCSEYTPCLQSSCPIETCDNLLVQAKEQQMCAQDTCVEGCQLKGCPEGQLYLNQTYNECVPSSVCKPVCLQLGGATYYEGDIIETDVCHTCRCNRGKKVCTGVPCSTTEGTNVPSTTTTTQRPYKDTEDVCKSGWSDWINQDSLDLDSNTSSNTESIYKNGDEEPMPSDLMLRNLKSSASCESEFITKIECRTVNTHLTPKETGEDVECSLERGLKGFGKCQDYEIRVFCNCGDVVEVATRPTPSRLRDSTTPYGEWNPITAAPTPAPWNSVSHPCDPAVPHVEYPGDCYKFLHCMPQADGSWKYAEKTCGPTMMYNPTSMTCDWIANVKSMKPECGHEPTPARIVATTPPTTAEVTKGLLLCPEGTVWSECAIPCRKSCHYYGKMLRKIGVCHAGSNECEPGCIDANIKPCTWGQLRRDEKTCVEVADCTCMSLTGKIAKPGIIHREYECKTCQCIDNEYVCDSSSCTNTKPPNVTTIRPPVTVTTVKPIIITSTMTPPAKCDRSKFVPMINGKQPLPDTAFKSSSNYGPSFQPQFAKLNSKPNAQSSGSWAPVTNDQNQYLEINFVKPIPLYGVIMQGSPIFEQYVTSFKILYSLDGKLYHYYVGETTADTPQIFRGPIDNRNPVETPFQVPIEARSVRIYPLTWHESIAVRVELLGCETPRAAPTTTTTTAAPSPKPYIPTTEQPMCDEPMGLDNGIMNPSQVRVSSSKSPIGVKSKPSKPFDSLRLSSSNGWSPKLNKNNEYVVFDFLEPRVITGLKTKGGRNGWVTAFKVEYSTDNIVWNIIEDENRRPKQFAGNFDEYSVHLNTFSKPIQTRYVKIVPLKWHDTIEMKIEPIGCFKPYPEITEKPIAEPTTVLPPPECGVCKGVLNGPSVVAGICRCYEPLFWNGNECISESECPCMVGHIAYDVGAKYELDDCSECNCLLGGIAQCKPQKCSKCAKGLRPVKSDTCSCKCEPCPEDHVLCETSGVCISESAWCDGIQDCPDDERNCDKETPNVVTEVKEIISIVKTCPNPSCPPGFSIKKAPKNSSPTKTSAMFKQSASSKQTVQWTYVKPTEFSNEIDMLASPKKLDQNPDDECIEFKCIPDKPAPTDTKNPPIVPCPKADCPQGYDVVFDNAISSAPSRCAKFTCEPQLKVDAICNVTCRTFNTFDGTEFKYDICNHVLARDLVENKWSISQIKNCSEGNYVCKKELLIRDRQVDTTVRLFADLTIELDDYKYTVAQLQRSSSAKLKSFTISNVGNTIIYVSHIHGFWVIWDNVGDVRIGVTANQATTVDGLCGYFNGIASDDKRRPNGDLTYTTMDFGDSWFVDKSKADLCEPHACPKDMQDLAWNMCNTVKHETFQQCGKNINVDRFVAQCMETACDCLMSSQKIDNKKQLNGYSAEVQQCKCTVLQNFAKECLASDETVHLDSWRSVHDCPSQCPTGLVHRDCYRRRCEPTCDSIRSAVEDCPTLPGTCFPGCYCPEGTVRKGSECVPMTECQDCVCDGFGQSQYLTYDRNNFTFDGNCTFLLSRDILVFDTYTFQVYATLGACEESFAHTKHIAQKDHQSSCTQSLHILYGPHIVHLQRGAKKNIRVLVDGIEARVLPLTKDWISVTEQPGRDVRIKLPKSHVELSAAFNDMAFSIRVPSVKYGSKMEGLCGDCNGNPKDDLKVNPKAKSPAKTDSSRDIIQTWLADEPKLPKEQECISKEEAEQDCIPLTPDQDPCMELIDENIFGRCHLIVDPIVRLSACQRDMCKTGPDQLGACKHLSAYALECSRKDICVDWKRGQCKENSTCPTGMTYKPCGCQRTCDTVIAESEHSIQACVKTEGCFCPDGQVNQNGKCIPEKQCRPCDDFGHNVGDSWRPDKCTECTCDDKQQTKCLKRECQLHGPICEIGYKEISIPSETECCPTFKCVPTGDTIKSNTTKCPDTSALPDCAPDQQSRKITARDGCQRFVCECKPYDECPPLKIHDLKPGEKMITDTTGCCPVHKVVCDKKRCPAKPTVCAQEFYEVQTLDLASPGQCCEQYECQAPKYTCIAEVNGKKTLKAMGEIWPTSNPCVNKRCAYGPNGLTEIVEETESCRKVPCKLGSELKAIDGKCCGECKQIACVYEDKIHKVGEHWASTDNCTAYECVRVNDNFVVTSSKEACPNVSECPADRIYIEGCCQRCKPEVVNQDINTCEATSLSDAATIKLVEKPTKKYGKCRNLQPIRGFTECNGRCSSGTRYDKATYKQAKKCECCSVATSEDLTVPLTCDTGFVLDLVVSVPKTCTCSPCEEDAYPFDVRSL